MSLNPRSKRVLATLLLVFLALASPAGAAGDEDTRTGAPPLIDLVLIRPVTFASAVLATAVWVPLVAIPTTATGNFETAGKTFTAGPGQMFARTFLVPLGH